MKDLPNQIKEQLQRKRLPQFNFCELCTGDHPTDYCPPPLKDELNYVGNQQWPS